MCQLVAFAGRSRSGKGTCAAVVMEMAVARGLTCRERQLSGPGKHHLASIFRPGVTEQDAVAWFEDLKAMLHTTVDVVSRPAPATDDEVSSVPLQMFLQHGLQGARDLWGDDFWTDMALPLDQGIGPGGFLGHGFEVDGRPADVCVISDLRQVNEAQRVHELGGIVVEVRRPENDDPYSCSPDHVTEQRLPDHCVDLRIVNDSDLVALHRRVVGALTSSLDYFARVARPA